jgi:hypothetical protein
LVDNLPRTCYVSRMGKNSKESSQVVLDTREKGVTWYLLQIQRRRGQIRQLEQEVELLFREVVARVVPPTDIIVDNTEESAVNLDE